MIELHDRASQPENLEVKTEEKVEEHEKGPYILHSEVKKAIDKMKDKKATWDDRCTWRCNQTVGTRWSKNNDTIYDL
jgi:hypothetical protein